MEERTVSINANTTIAIIQARTGSTRLSNKILRPLAGAPMLARQIERVRRARRLDDVIIATTDLPADDAVEELASTLKVGCFRGSESDVLGRYYEAAKAAGAITVVRITGDCPLHDPAVIDEVIEHFMSARDSLDYSSTPRNYPEGLDTEVFTFAALETAWKNAHLPSEREHVTPYLKNHPEQFTCDQWDSGTADNSAMHWSVDTEADLAFVESVYNALYEDTPEFTMHDVLALLKTRPELLKINAGGTGYEGLEKSIREDKEFLASQS